MIFVLPHGEIPFDAFVLGEVGDGELDLLSVEPVDGDIDRLGGVEVGHAGERSDEVIDAGTGGRVKLHKLAGIGEDVADTVEDHAKESGRTPT